MFRLIEVPVIFQGMKFYDTTYRPEGWDQVEDDAVEVGWDQKLQKMVVWLGHNDYREHGDSGSQQRWTDNLVNEYRDWELISY